MRKCDAAVKMWLGDLQTTGLDLKIFGQTEESLFNSGYSDKTLSYKWVYGWLRLINFTYGSSPDDWHLWISVSTDYLVGEFWCLVKRQEEVMPGAWPDDLPYKM